jgi:tRNA(adenine34) deaminase
MNDDPDLHSMALALDEARVALAAGDYPVGAALVVDGALWGTARNALFSDGRTTAHAEHTLIAAQSARLRAAQARTICLSTTLEPCLMCLGIAVLHKVTRIVYACPDPHGGATRLDYTRIGSVYPRLWPAIVAGPLRRESCDLIIEFLRTDKFLSAPVMLPAFLALQAEP